MAFINAYSNGSMDDNRMEEIMPIWGMALWATLVLVSITFLFQLVARRNLIEESYTISELTGNNKKLAEQIVILQTEISNLNNELKRLTSENKLLNQEVKNLSSEVTRIRSSINGV